MKAACKHLRILYCAECHVETLKSKVEEMQKALDKAILEIRIWSSCYGDDASKQVASKVVEELRQVLKGAINEQSS